MTKIQEQEIEKAAIEGTTSEIQKEIIESDGYILITQKADEHGEKELSISGGKDMSPVDIASMILTLADQNEDLKTILKADFIKMAGNHILDIADSMLKELNQRIAAESDEQAPETVQ